MREAIRREIVKALTGFNAGERRNATKERNKIKRRNVSKERRITSENRKKRFKTVAVEPQNPYVPFPGPFPVPVRPLYTIVRRIEDAPPKMTCPKCLNTGFAGGRIHRTEDECFCTPPKNRQKAVSIETQDGDSRNPYACGLVTGSRMFRDVVEQGPVPLISTGEQFAVQPLSRTYWLCLNRRRKAVAKESALQEAEAAA
jgi:hypothetical protein